MNLHLILAGPQPRPIEFGVIVASCSPVIAACSSFAVSVGQQTALPEPLVVHTVSGQNQRSLHHKFASDFKENGTFGLVATRLLQNRCPRLPNSTNLTRIRADMSETLSAVRGSFHIADMVESNRRKLACLQLLAKGIHPVDEYNLSSHVVTWFDSCSRDRAHALIAPSAFCSQYNLPPPRKRPLY